MRKKTVLRSAHADTVNSIFISFDAGVVISVEQNSIRLWDSTNGTQFYQTDMDDADNSVIPGLGSIYRMESVIPDDPNLN